MGKIHSIRYVPYFKYFTEILINCVTLGSTCERISAALIIEKTFLIAMFQMNFISIFYYSFWARAFCTCMFLKFEHDGTNN